MQDLNIILKTTIDQSQQTITDLNKQIKTIESNLNKLNLKINLDTNVLKGLDTQIKGINKGITFKINTDNNLKSVDEQIKLIKNNLKNVDNLKINIDKKAISDYEQFWESALSKRESKELQMQERIHSQTFSIQQKLQQQEERALNETINIKLKLQQQEEQAQKAIQSAIEQTIEKRKKINQMEEQNQNKAINKNLEQQYKEEQNLIEQIAKAREQSVQRQIKAQDDLEKKQAQAINKNLENQYKQQEAEKSNLASQAMSQINKINNEILANKKNIISASEQEVVIYKQQNELLNQRKNNLVNSLKSNGLLTEERRVQLINQATEAQRLLTRESELNRVSEEKTNVALLEKVKLQQDGYKIRLQELQRNYGDLINTPQLKQQFADLQNVINNLHMKPENFRTKEISNQINQLTADIKSNSSATREGQKDVVTWGERFNHALSTVGIYYSATQLISQGLNAFRQGIQDVIALDSALTTLNITMDMTKDDMTNMIGTTQTLAKEMKTSVQNVLEIAKVYTNMNESVQSILDKTRPAILLATLAGLNPNEATNTIQSILNQYEMGTENIEKDSMRITDSITKISASMAYDFSDGVKQITEGLQVSGSVAKEAGFELENYEAILGSLIEKTRLQGSQIGNSLKTIFSRLGRAKTGDASVDEISAAEKAYREIGIEIRDLNGEFRKTPEILNELSGKWDNLTKVQRSYISEVSAGVRQKNIFLSMMNSWEQSANLTTQALNAQGFAMERNEIRAKSAQATFEEFKTTLTTMWQNLISSDVIKGFVSTITKLVEVVGFMTEKLGLLPTVATAAMISMVAFNKVSFASNNIFGLIGQGVGKLIATLGVLNIKAIATTAIMTALNVAIGAGLIWAITTVVSGFIKLADAMHTTREEREELIKKHDENIQSLTSQKKALQELSKEYEALKSKEKTLSLTIDEKKRLSDIEQELVDKYGISVSQINLQGEAYGNSVELINLRIQALQEEIDKEIELRRVQLQEKDKEDIEDIDKYTKQKKQAEETIQEWNKMKLELEKSLSNHNSPKYKEFVNLFGEGQAEYKIKEEIQKLSKEILDAQSQLKEATDKLNPIFANRLKVFDNDAEKYIAGIEATGKKLTDKNKAVISQFVESISKSDIDYYQSSDMIKKFIDDLAKTDFDKVADKYQKAKEKFTKDPSPSNKSELSNMSKEIGVIVDNVTNKFNPTTEEGKKAVEDFKNAIKANFSDNIINETGEAKQGVDGLSQSLKDSKTAYEEFSKALSDASSEISYLNKIIDQLNQGQSLTGQEATNLTSKYPQLIKNIQKTADGYTIETSVLRELTNARVDGVTAVQRGQLESTRITLEQTLKRLGIYKAEIKTLEDLGKAQDAINQKSNSMNYSGGDVGEFYKKKQELANVYSQTKQYGDLLSEIEKTEMMLKDPMLGLEKSSKKATSETNKALKDQNDILEETISKYETLKKMKDNELYQTQYNAEKLNKTSEEYRNNLQKQINLLKEKQKINKEEQDAVAKIAKTPVQVKSNTNIKPVSSINSPNQDYTGKYADLINKYASQNGFDPKLIAAIIEKESGFNPNAVNKSSRASGLMQFLPSTWKSEGGGDVFDPELNIKRGVEYLRKRVQWAGGDLRKGIKGYGDGTESYVNDVFARYNKIAGGNYNSNKTSVGVDGKKDYTEKANSKIQDLQKEALDLQRDIDKISYESVKSKIAEFEDSLSSLDQDLSFIKKKTESYADDDIKRITSLDNQNNLLKQKQDIMHQEATFLREQIKNGTLTGEQLEEYRRRVKDLSTEWWNLNNVIEDNKLAIDSNKIDILLTQYEKSVKSLNHELKVLQFRFDILEETNLGAKLKLNEAIYQKQALVVKQYEEQLAKLEKTTASTVEGQQKLNEAILEAESNYLSEQAKLKNLEKEKLDIRGKLAEQAIRAIKKGYEEQQKIDESYQKDIIKNAEETHKQKIKLLDNELKKHNEVVDGIIQANDRLNEKEDYEYELGKLQEDRNKALAELNLAQGLSTNDPMRDKKIQEAQTKLKDLDENIRKLTLTRTRKLTRDQLEEVKKQKEKEITVTKNAEDKKLENVKKTAEDEIKLIKDKYDRLINNDRFYEDLKKQIISGTYIEAEKTIKDVLSRLQMNNEHTVKKLGESWQSIKNAIDSATKSLESFNSVNLESSESYSNTDTSVKNRRVVSVRDYLEGKGYNVKWNNNNGQILVNGQAISKNNFTYDSNQKKHFAPVYQIEEAVKGISSNKTSRNNNPVSVRDYIEAKGYKVAWDGKNQKILIDGKAIDRSTFSYDSSKNKHYATPSQIDSALNKIGIYHNGGFVGDGENTKLPSLIEKMFNLKPNEQIIKALKGELMIPQENIMSNFMPNLQDLINSVILNLPKFKPLNLPNFTPVSTTGNTEIHNHYDIDMNISKLNGDKNGAKTVLAELVNQIKKKGGDIL